MGVITIITVLRINNNEDLTYIIVQLGLFLVEVGNERYVIIADYNDLYGKYLSLLFKNEIPLFYKAQYAMWKKNKRVFGLIPNPIRPNMSVDNFNNIKSLYLEGIIYHTLVEFYREFIWKPNSSHWIHLEHNLKLRVQTGFNHETIRLYPYLSTVSHMQLHIPVHGAIKYTVEIATPTM